MCLQQTDSKTREIKPQETCKVRYKAFGAEGSRLVLELERAESWILTMQKENSREKKTWKQRMREEKKAYGTLVSKVVFG